MKALETMLKRCGKGAACTFAHDPLEIRERLAVGSESEANYLRMSCVRCTGYVHKLEVLALR